MPVLSLSGATQAIGEKRVLGPVDLDLPLAGVTAVLGANGAGKSLFLALCHGMRRPDAGRVTWDGIPAHRRRRARGYMMQAPVVLRRTVAANVEFPLQSMGVPALQRRDRVADALRRARLEDFADAPAATLSGGEMRRMALARALVTEPGALILDEPFAGLDPRAESEIEAIITAIAPTVPVLVSTHDLPQARRLAGRVLFFSEGQLVENADAATFFDGPADASARDFLKGHLL